MTILFVFPININVNIVKSYTQQNKDYIDTSNISVKRTRMKI